MNNEKNGIARAGNFVVSQESVGDHDYIRIESTSGHWSITHRDDSPMYGAWMMMCKDPESRKGMEVIITMSYHLTNSILDKEFVEDFFNALDAMGKRKVANAPIPTEEEEAEALETIEILEKAKEILTGEDESM